MDIFLYSKPFYADRVSLIQNELNIASSHQSVIKEHVSFFNNKERVKKFQAYGIEAYTEELIELAMMSVLCNIKTPDFETVLKTVLIDTLDDAENRYLRDFERFFSYVCIIV